MEQRSLFGLSEHLERLGKKGDPLETLDTTVDFEHFRGWLVEGLGYGDGAKGGRPLFDPVAMFKALILQAQHNLSDARMEFMIRDRLSWMRFLGFDLGAPTPDENTIRHFRNRLTETGTLKWVMKAFDWQLQKKGYIPMAGQIVDASLVPAPKQHNTEGEKAAIKAGKSAHKIWPNEPAKAAQKDVDARWTLKIGGKVRYRPDGTPLPMIATPVFGYKSHISIDQRFGFIRESAATSAAAPDGRQLRHLVSRENTGSQVWADSAYRSGENEKWLAERMVTSRIHRRKPAGKSMLRAMAQANAKKSSVRAAVEHVFAHQKIRFGLFIRTIGPRRGETDARQHRLQHGSPDLPRGSRDHGMSPLRNGQKRHANTLDRSKDGARLASPDDPRGKNHRKRRVLAGVQLAPDLADAVDAEVHLEDAADLAAELAIAALPGRPARRIPFASGVFVIGRRGYRQNPAVQLDPIEVTMIVDDDIIA